MFGNINPIALYLARKLKDPKFNYLRNLKRIIEQRPSNRSINLLAIKESLKIEIERICFSDIFFKEEFPALEKGLANLINRHYCSRQSNDKLLAKEELRQWFRDINRFTRETLASNHSLGYINFHIEDEFKYLEVGYVYLKFVSPSFITLVTVFTTSDFLKKEFTASILASQDGETVMSNFNPLNGELPSYELKSSFNYLEEKVEELFFKVKKSASLFFCKNLGVGLSTSGILPSFEILSCNFSSLRSVSNMPSQSSQGLKERALFLRGLGYPPSQSLTEVQRGYVMYEISRRRYHAHHLSYQLLLSICVLRNTKHASLNYGDSDSIESIIESVIHEKVIKALHLLAIQNFYEYLYSKIILTNKQLEPVLLGRKSISGNPRNMILEIKNLNKKYCQSLRVFSFKEESLLWLALNVPNNKYPNTYYEDRHNKKSILIDLKLSIQEAKNLCEATLSFLKTNYEQAASYQLNILDYKLQKIALLISIMTGLLTFLAIPEEFRAFAWSEFSNGIKSIISIYIDK